ncbi:MAG: hypothetical protein R3B54_02540 [Bdellovibrionota bacterium]
MKLALVSFFFLFSSLALAGHPADDDCWDNPLTVPLLDVSGATIQNLDELLPLGNTFGGHVLPTSHMYLNLDRVDPGNQQSISVDTGVLSPGEVKIVAIAPHDDTHTPGVTIQAYKVTMKICKDTYLFVDHLNTIDSAITNITGPISAPYWYDPNGIPIAAGADIGRTRSTHALDMGVFDVNFLAPYISPLLYHPDYATLASALSLNVSDVQILLPSKAYKKCPLDYFTSSTQSLLLAYNPRTAPPVCGDFAQDLAGRAQGSWLPLKWNSMPLLYGVDASEDEALALGYDYIDPSLPLISVGETVPLTNAAGTVVTGTLAVRDYYFSPYSTPPGNLENWLFADISTGSDVYCYRDLYTIEDGAITDRVLLLQMDQQTVNGSLKTVLRVQARDRSDCPAVGSRNLGAGMTEDFARD